jgi:hypothetical protein
MDDGERIYRHLMGEPEKAGEEASPKNFSGMYRWENKDFELGDLLRMLETGEEASGKDGKG